MCARRCILYSCPMSHAAHALKSERHHCCRTYREGYLLGTEHQIEVCAGRDKGFFSRSPHLSGRTNMGSMGVPVLVCKGQ